MKRKVFWAIVLATACGGAGTARARLGETPMELAQRYGAANETKAFEPFTRCRYEKLGFLVDVYFLSGRSVMEVFAKRGLGAEEAAGLVTKVAGQPAPAVQPQAGQKIRNAAGMTKANEMFWSWAGRSPAGPVIAAFNPLECSVVFFGNPAIYAQVHKVLAASR